MNKRLKIVILFTIVLAILLTCVSCSLQKKYENAANSYLKNKYPQLKFEMLSYTKDSEDASGRYQVKLKCLNDGVVFDMYIYSSILITDSYDVERANYKMYELIQPILKDSGVGNNIKNVEWLRKYNEQSTDGSFISYDYPEDITLADLKNSIYRVYLNDSLTLEEVAYSILNISRSFELYDKSLEKVGFSFKYNNKEYVANISTKSTIEITEKELSKYLLEKIESNTSSTNRLFDLNVTKSSIIDL